MAAVLSSDMDGTDKVVNFLGEARALGLTVQPPNVNASDYMFVAADETDYSILDEDELEIARANRLISADLCGRILNQLDQLTEMLENGQFGAWLRATCPASFDLALLTSHRDWQNLDFTAGEHDNWPEELD